MKLGSVVATLLLTTITFLGSAGPGQGTGKAGSVPHTGHAQSEGSISGITTRVSVASDGSQGYGYGHSGAPSISADGRIVAFIPQASLTVVDSNICESDHPYPWYVNCSDIFVHDRDSNETTRVSVASNGTEGNDPSYAGSISSDGRFVLFDSWASNLVGSDSNGFRDVFVHDRDIGETTRVSVATGGLQGDNDAYGAAISADGQFVVFDSGANDFVDDDSNGNQDAFLHDRESGETIRVSVASGGIEVGDPSGSPAVSADGSVVAFESMANNLVNGDTNTCYARFGPPPPCQDVFVHDRDTVPTFAPFISR